MDMTGKVGLKGNKVTSTVMMIRNGVITNDNSVSTDAYNAIKVVLRMDKIEDVLDQTLREMRTELVEIAINHLWWGKLPGLKHALDCMKYIIQNDLYELNNNQQDKMNMILERLLNETSIDSNQMIPEITDRIEIRIAAAAVAFELFKCCSNNEATISEILHSWQETCLSPDEFAEIRNIWK